MMSQGNTKRLSMFPEVAFSSRLSSAIHLDAYNEGNKSLRQRKIEIKTMQMFLLNADR